MEADNEPRLVVMLALLFSTSLSFMPQPPFVSTKLVGGTNVYRTAARAAVLRAALDEDADGIESSLQQKMASWDATDEEQRASTLGGNLPLVGLPGKPGRMTRKDQPTKMDGFDVGMNISGLVLFPLAILLLSVPFWIGTIDVSDVGPPPTS